MASNHSSHFHTDPQQHNHSAMGAIETTTLGHYAHDHGSHSADMDHSAHSAGDVDHSAHHSSPSMISPAAGDHPAHQHHHGSGSSHQMSMFFHGGTSEVILFDWWRVDSFCSLFFSFLVIFLMAAAYEGLKWFRVYFQAWANVSASRSGRQPAVISLKNLNNGGDGLSSHNAEDALIQKTAATTCQSNCCGASTDQVYAPTVTPGNGDEQQSRFRWLLPLLNSSTIVQSPNVSRLVEAALYCVQLLLAYCLMLIAMTYNIYLTAGVVLGAGFGHWLFANLKIAFKCANCKCVECKCTPTEVKATQAENFTSDACH